MRSLHLKLTTLCLLFALHAPLALSQSQDNPPKPATIPAEKPSADQIAAAKASGKVWVNLDSGVYHKGGRWYGKTKNGKFMTEDEARKLGYKSSKKD